jgi:glycosyltransferase involved in cell wall biosynthesis
LEEAPLLSIILPVYNAEDYVQDSIQSVLNQTFIDFELIIINDGSTDQSESKILQFTDSRIRYIKNEVNLKLIATLNLGLELARGTYIARLDADDIALQDRFSIQVNFLERQPDYGLIGSFAYLFGSETGTLEYVQEDFAIRYALLTHNPFIHSTVMFRNSIIKNYNLSYDVKQMHVEDYDLWLKILNFTKGKVIPEYLIRYRVHTEQISSIYKDLQIQNALSIQKKYFLSEFSKLKHIDVLISIFYSEYLDIPSKCLAFYDFTQNYGSIDSLLKIKVRASIENKIKDSVLDLKSISWKDFCTLFKLRQIFTLKQKLALFLKIIRN